MVRTCFPKLQVFSLPSDWSHYCFQHLYSQWTGLVLTGEKKWTASIKCTKYKFNKQESHQKCLWSIYWWHQEQHGLSTFKHEIHLYQKTLSNHRTRAWWSTILNSTFCTLGFVTCIPAQPPQPSPFSSHTVGAPLSWSLLPIMEAPECYWGTHPPHYN